MRVDVLGPVRVVRGGGVVALGAPRQRAVVAALALHPDRNVSAARIVELVWQGHPPPGVATTLQAYVSGLRRVLEPDRVPGVSGEVLVTVPGGYRLALAPDDVDASRFAETVLDVHRDLAPHAGFLRVPGAPSPPGEQLHTLGVRLGATLALWRGEPYDELGDAEDARTERSRLAELRLVALEDRAVLDLWVGQAAAVAAELEPLVGAHPWRERLVGLRALALARSGRQADALGVLSAARAALDEELGLEPGVELRDLQTAILRQDPMLSWAVVPPAAGTSRAHPLQTREPTRVPPTDRWPLVGRQRELQTLLEALDAAVAGEAAFVGLVGEAGIGKSRLARELDREARSRGVVVLSARCSQDDGAPPLWPWATVLRALDRGLPDLGPDGSDFAAWEEVVDSVVRAAARPTLLVFDDLHWADPATLRVLRLLVEHPDPGRLLVVLTWRGDQAPSDAFADLLEALARRHAGRLALTGLSADDASRVVGAVVGAPPDPGQAALLRARTDGNPFFLVEYASLAAGGAELGTLLAEPHPPVAVHDVVQRRLGRLPAATIAAVRSAAVGGRVVELNVLAAVTARRADDLLDDLEPALTAGLLHEDGVDRFRFAHALVRDSTYLSIPTSRRARAHAVLAEVLQQRGGRETEVAHHWAAAGDAHLGRAWRSAVAAAEVATRLHDREQAARLLEGALDLLERDPQVLGEDRVDVLLLLVEAYRWSGRWSLLVTSVERAVVLARDLDDVPRLASAAIGTTRGTAWQSSAYGQVNAVVVGALRESLQRLPTADSALRARVMLSLAVETYYGSTVAERDALVEEALAMAGRLSDDTLLLEAYLTGVAAQWRPATAHQRLAYAQSARALASRLGREQDGVVAATLMATTQAELGRLDDMTGTIATASAEAERLHLPYSQIVLDELVVGLQAMAGRFAVAEDTLDRIVRLHERIGVQQTSDAVAGSRAAVLQWQGRWAEVGQVLSGLRGSPLPTTAVGAALLLAAGQRDEAQALLAARPIDVDTDDWLSLHTWCHAAEVALALGDRPLGARVYARLAPYAGRLCMAGSSPTGGPVDAFLALAAHAVGEDAAALRHATDGLALMERWHLPVAAERFRSQRLEHGF